MAVESGGGPGDAATPLLDGAATDATPLAAAANPLLGKTDAEATGRKRSHDADTASLRDHGDGNQSNHGTRPHPPVGHGRHLDAAALFHVY